MNRSVDPGHRTCRQRGLDRCRLPKVPDETRMKQYTFPCENVVKQIAGINDLDQTTGADS